MRQACKSFLYVNGYRSNIHISLFYFIKELNGLRGWYELCMLHVDDQVIWVFSTYTYRSVSNDSGSQSRALTHSGVATQRSRPNWVCCCSYMGFCVGSSFHVFLLWPRWNMMYEPLRMTYYALFPSPRPPLLHTVRSKNIGASSKVQFILPVINIIP